MWRFVRTWVAQNHKLYYTYVLICSWAVYEFWWYTVVGYYRRRNYHRSLDYAILREKEWELNKPKEEDEEYEEEGEGGEGASEGGEATAEGEEAE